jgi:mono/diheme cytochrome c family protein
MLRHAIMSWAMAGCSVLMFLIVSAAPVTAGEPPWVAPAAEKAKKNPVSRATGVPEGKKVFETNCAMCHGQAGKGDGAAAVALNPKPADLSSKAIQSQTDGELFWKISTGRGAMPSWQTLPETDRWSVVDFVRSLGGKK